MPTAPAPAPATHAALPPRVEAGARYRADRLARVFSLPAADRDQLAQDLRLELVRALARHDPGVARVETFARGVMDRWYAATARRIRRRREREAGCVSLADLSPQSFALRDHRPDEQRAADLRMDLEPLLDSLPRDLRALAEQLKTKSVAEIAAERGVHRGTVHRLVVRLRERLAPAAELLA